MLMIQAPNGHLMNPAALEAAAAPKAQAASASASSSTGSTGAKAQVAMMGTASAALAHYTEGLGTLLPDNVVSPSTRHSSSQPTAAPKLGPGDLGVLKTPPAAELGIGLEKSVPAFTAAAAVSGAADVVAGKVQAGLNVAQTFVTQRLNEAAQSDPSMGLEDNVAKGAVSSLFGFIGGVVHDVTHPVQTVKQLVHTAVNVGRVVQAVQGPPTGQNIQVVRSAVSGLVAPFKMAYQENGGGVDGVGDVVGDAGVQVGLNFLGPEADVADGVGEATVDTTAAESAARTSVTPDEAGPNPATAQSPTSGAAKDSSPSSGPASQSSSTAPADGASGQVVSKSGPSDSSGSPPGYSLFGVHPSGGNPGVDVAILGGGNVGHTLNADLELNTGLTHKLLFSGDGSRSDRIGPSTGTVTFKETLHGSTNSLQLGREHFGYVDTPAGADALRQAKIVVVTIPDAPLSRLGLFNKLQSEGLVEDPEKTYVLIRAGQAGQPALAQIIRNNPDWNSSVVGVEDAPYGTRYVQTADGPVITGKRKDDVEISVAGQNGNEAPGLAAMRSLFPLGEQIGKASWPDFAVVPGANVLFKAGYILHPGVALDPLNLELTQRGIQYLHYSEGVYPALGEKLATLDGERLQLADAFGVQAETFPQKLERQFGLTWNPGESFYETMQRTGRAGETGEGSEPVYSSKSYPSVPELLKNRYAQEDTPAVFTMNFLAERAGVSLPAHAQYESDLREQLSRLGMPEAEVHTKLEGYLPYLDQIQGGVPEITQLLNAPHVRS